MVPFKYLVIFCQIRSPYMCGDWDGVPVVCVCMCVCVCGVLMSPYGGLFSRVKYFSNFAK